jgi:mRNA-degrading endonuclease RelE of RelBE toxin-antitoxin system
LLAVVERKHRGNRPFITAVDEALADLQVNPFNPRRVIKLRDNRYRYRHRRCRVIFTVNQEQREVRVLRIDQRDESTYKRLD